MGHLLVSGVSYFVQNALLTPLQRFIFSILSHIAQQGLAFARLPFVVSTADSMAAVAAALFITRVAWEALSRYRWPILFNIPKCVLYWTRCPRFCAHLNACVNRPATMTCSSIISGMPIPWWGPSGCVSS